MKKIVKKIVLLVMVTCCTISLCACNGGNKKAFETSKSAYERISLAYEVTDQFGSDVYEAWRMGIYDDDELLESGIEHLATGVNLSESELIDGAAYVLAEELFDEDWESLSDSEKQEYKDTASSPYVFVIMEDSLFSFCVMIISGAYEVSGKTEEVQTALDDAKVIMKELSEKYSDYEHYPNLKGFYTTTSSFFEFCQDPTGSFEQIKDTINDYRNEARDYASDLDYIFE